MKDINYYSIKHIVRIEIKDKSENDYIKYFKYKKCFFNGTIKEGFYDLPYSRYKPYNCKPCSIDDLKNGKVDDIKYIIEDNKVYFKPCVGLHYSNGNKRYQTFDTYDKAIEYVEIIKQKIGNDIIINI